MSDSSTGLGPQSANWNSGPVDLTNLAASVGRLVQQNEQLLAALSSSTSHIEHNPAQLQYHERQKRKAESIRQWREEILPHKINDPQSPLGSLRSSFRWPRKRAGQLRAGVESQDVEPDDDEPDEERKFEDMFSPEQPWNSWQYRLAYPSLSTFLESGDHTKSTKSEVLYIDFHNHDDDNQVDEWMSTEKRETLPSVNVDQEENQEGPPTKVLRQNILDHKELWKHIKTRIDESPKRGSSTSGLGLGRLQEEYRVPCRILRITDLSATVAALVMGSTPRLDLAYIAPFLERYLKFSNWATARVIISGDNAKPVNTYLFEYHFAFYYVPKISMDPELASKDFRGIRNIAGFGRGSTNHHRYIYEEQLSFILVGHGGDVYTNYQLAEKYYVGPYLKGAEGISVFVARDGWKPHTMFLTWISVALHHVNARWQTAIDAIDSQIDSPFEVIFHEDKPDLLSDDPHFSRSKTYFWAIQVYKLFEEVLTKTITTWEDFKADSLDLVNDGNIDHWDSTIRQIDGAIQALRVKLSRVQKKREEVINLRDGLFGASSLFDSRTSVRQGDNIRLLTYVNLLFLPLTFCTSVFGMQTILPTPLPMKAFIITLPSLTVITTLLVFNLEYLADLSERASQKITSSLRGFMAEHRRKEWKRTAEALREDRTATEMPVKKRTRRSSHWMYLVFILEAILVTIPVNEVRSALGLWGLRTRLRAKVKNTSSETDSRHVDSALRAQMVGEKQKIEKKEGLRRHRRQSRLARWALTLFRASMMIMFSVLRAILSFVLWIPLLLVELGTLYLFTVLLFIYTGNSTNPTSEPPHTLHEKWYSAPGSEREVPFDWTLPLHVLGLHDIHHYPALTAKQRAQQHWSHLLQNPLNWLNLESRPIPMPVDAYDNNASPAPKPLIRRIRRRTTTFLTPRTRTATGLFHLPKKRPTFRTPAATTFGNRMTDSKADKVDGYASSSHVVEEAAAAATEPDLERGPGTEDK